MGKENAWFLVSIKQLHQRCLKRHENGKEGVAYRMMNVNLAELEYIKIKVSKTPDCY